MYLAMCIYTSIKSLKKERGGFSATLELTHRMRRLVEFMEDLLHARYFWALCPSHPLRYSKSERDYCVHLQVKKLRLREAKRSGQ